MSQSVTASDGWIGEVLVRECEVSLWGVGVSQQAKTKVSMKKYYNCQDY